MAPADIDWSAGAALSRAGYTRHRGIPTAAPQQFEYDWAFAFGPDDPMEPYFLVNGVARNETGSAVGCFSGASCSEVTEKPAYRMCHNAPLWEHVQGQVPPFSAATSSHLCLTDFPPRSP